MNELKALKAKGLAGAIYTQLTDVEGEINEYLTYDREILKMDKNLLIEFLKALYHSNLTINGGIKTQSQKFPRLLLLGLLTRTNLIDVLQSLLSSSIPQASLVLA